MTRLKKLTVPLMVAALATAGCESAGTGMSTGINAQAVGAALGAVGGGLAGTQVGKGNGRTAAIIGGTILGGIIGSAVAARLSPQGQQVAYNTTQQAMTTAPVNQPVQWQDPNTQIYGTVTPTTTPYYVQVDPAGYMGPPQAQPPQGYIQQPQPQYTQQQQQYAQPQYSQPQAVATSSGAECRDYQTAVFSGGQPETLTGRMCRRGPGQPWRPANDGYVGI